MSAELLQTKLYIPSPRSNAVARSRLIDQLSQGIRQGNKLTLISAPAGFGKTTLLAEWLSQFEAGGSPAGVGKRGAAWLSLEPEDNDTARFLSYLVAALQKIDPGVGGKMEAMLKASHLPSIESLMTPLINELVSMSEPFLLVMDDYHMDMFVVAQSARKLLATVPQYSNPYVEWEPRNQKATAVLATLRGGDYDSFKELVRETGLDYLVLIGEWYNLPFLEAVFSEDQLTIYRINVENSESPQ